MRPLASHQCDLNSISKPGITFGSSLFLVTIFAAKVFLRFVRVELPKLRIPPLSIRVPPPPPPKPTVQNHIQSHARTLLYKLRLFHVAWEDKLHFHFYIYKPSVSVLAVRFHGM